MRGHVAVGPLPLLHHRLDDVGERPAHLPAHRRWHRGAGPQRQPGQHRRTGRPSPGRRAEGTQRRARAGPPPTPTSWARCWPTAPPTHPRGRRPSTLLPTVRGAFCLTFMDENTLYAARDPHGVRPLSLGRLDRGWVVASETAALDIVGASFVRDIEPGELLAIDADGVRSHPVRRADPQGLRLRVRLPGPPGQRRSPAARCTPPGSRWAARWPGSTRSRPTW
jgi:hypothetical protein